MTWPLELWDHISCPLGIRIQLRSRAHVSRAGADEGRFPKASERRPLRTRHTSVSEGTWAQWNHRQGGDAWWLPSTGTSPSRQPSRDSLVGEVAEPSVSRTRVPWHRSSGTFQTEPGGDGASRLCCGRTLAPGHGPSPII